ncbi:hypothetical protein SAMN06269185_2948 [Natronoarchaeum philippinense]|uniref:Uncharacterized protein n=1 Tax=Natronoarchaeum philippinense TaxID=558529 RepID=A0A285PBL6_NATPI|nr:hypothetical protein [Natronoarchaeum philippinense]SNZ17251.1 hypothetical protein SAMN06269185_2948 [Natronoarchaeum philippinense]
MTTRGDASLALVALLAFGIALVEQGVAPDPGALAVGALGTVLFEAVAGRFYERVRRHWERRGVQVLALGLAVGVAVAVALLGVRTLTSAALGALGAYLCLLALVAGGVVAPPREWFGSDDDR